VSKMPDFVEDSTETRRQRYDFACTLMARPHWAPTRSAQPTCSWNDGGRQSPHEPLRGGGAVVATAYRLSPPFVAIDTVNILLDAGRSGASLISIVEEGVRDRLIQEPRENRDSPRSGDSIGAHWKAARGITDCNRCVPDRRGPDRREGIQCRDPFYYCGRDTGRDRRKSRRFGSAETGNSDAFEL
jgi:hypothetical protein